MVEEEMGEKTKDEGREKEGEAEAENSGLGYHVRQLHR